MKHIKLICLFVFLLLSICFVKAQINADSTKKHRKKTRPPVENPIELRFNIGMANPLGVKSGAYPFLYNGFPGTSGATNIDFYGDAFALPTFNFNYTYRLRKWLSFGLNLSYQGAFERLYDANTYKKIATQGGHYLGLHPTLRFDWYCSRTDMVRLYSAVGLGFSFLIFTTRIINPDEGKSPRLYGSGYGIVLDAVPFGIAVGKKVFGFFEIAFSTHGVIKMGVGYRMNEKKTNKTTVF